MKWTAGSLVVAALLFVAVTVMKRQAAHESDRADGTAIPVEARARARQFWETYRRATDLRIAGRLADAADAYATALTLVPSHQDALYYLGSVDFERGDLAGAERAWHRLVAVDPSNGRGHAQLGVLYSCFGKPALLDLGRAAGEFRRALAINREQTGPLLDLGEIALVQGDLAQARSYFDSVVGSNYTSVAAHVYRAYLAWKAGAPSQAAALLTAAAGHARAQAQAAALPGEGDTRNGSVPAALASDTCRPMRGTVADLARPDDQVTRGAEARYRALDALLQNLRRSLPSPAAMPVSRAPPQG
jgi:tetratricopeptide (TPR) repeat protein